MTIVSKGIISRCISTDFQYNAWGSIISLHDGTLLCAWSGERYAHICPFGRIMLSRSTDGGKTWDKPACVFDSPLDDRDAGLCQGSDGTVYLTTFTNSRKMQRFYAQERQYPKHTLQLFEEKLRNISDAEEHAWLGSIIARLNDGGHSFENAALLPITSPHGPLVLPDCKLLYIGRAFSDLTDAAFDYLPEGIWAMTIDKNLHANTARLLFPADPDPHTLLCEPHACLLPSGKIILGIRVQNYRTGLFTIFDCFSTDFGKTFTPLRKTDFEGSPPHYFVHSSGALILTYGRRKFPYAQIARVSYDEGIHWSEEIILNDQCCDDDIGYPSTAENQQGQLVTTYYQRPSSDYQKAQICYTIWEL